MNFNFKIKNNMPPGQLRVARSSNFELLYNMLSCQTNLHPVMTSIFSEKLHSTQDAVFIDINLL